MVAFSPIAATYGNRVEQLLETTQDFERYHEKLNRKLQKLRHRCQLVNKSTKKYSANDKYGKLSSADYDKKNKLYGVLVLLHAERDLALAETLKVKARQRGRFKANEKKVVGTRLKKVVKTTQNLVEVTANEAQWLTRAQYIVYAKLAHAEYLLNGKFSKSKESGKISHNLALCFAALSLLCKSGALPEIVYDFLHSKYEYSLKQHAGKIVSASDLQKFIVGQVKAGEQNDDELAKLIIENGYKAELPDVDMEKETSIKKIQYRAFVAHVDDPQVEQAIIEAENIKAKTTSEYGDKVLKWQQALEKQETRIAYHEQEDDEENGDDSHENDQILLAYIKYNVLLTSTLRDSLKFEELYDKVRYPSTGHGAYNELDRVMKTVSKSLVDIMELPGVYSDDELMAQLQLTQAYFEAKTSYCLACTYSRKYQYDNSLALHLFSLEKLDNAKASAGELEEHVLPDELLTESKIGSLRESIMGDIKNELTLAKYKDSVAGLSHNSYEPSVIEQLGSGPVDPTHIRLDNLFPMRPKMRPVQSKPSLFDLAFNYIDYKAEDTPSNDHIEETELPRNADAEQEQESAKPRGFLGLFGR